MSALAIPVLIPFAAVALVLMGRRRAAWWVVPVLWPSTQWYYTSLVMPATTLLAAFVVAVPVPYATTLGAVVVAGEVVWRSRRAPPAGDTAAEPGAATA